MTSGAAIDRLATSVYVVPTDAPESDGALEWESTTMVVVEARAGDRCGIGYTWNVPLSAHTAPSLHSHVCAAVPHVAHVEYFHDHVRIEQMFFDGAARAERGLLRPDRTRLELKRADADRDRRS